MTLGGEGTCLQGDTHGRGGGTARWGVHGSVQGRAWVLGGCKDWGYRGGGGSSLRGARQVYGVQCVPGWGC